MDNNVGPAVVDIPELTQSFIGTKVIRAAAMTREDYNDLRGWTVPENEDGADEGYIVEYVDGGKPNTPHYQGYISWSPKEQFENAYRPVDAFSFGMALEALRKGYRVSRAGWNGKGMWLAMVMPPMIQVMLPPEGYTLPSTDGQLIIHEYIAMRTVQGHLIPWLASQADMLAEDWSIVQFESETVTSTETGGRE